MKPSRIFIGILILVAVLLVIKFIFFAPGNSKSAASAPAKSAALSVSVYVATSEKLDNKVYASGSVLANEEVDLRPEASGKILHVYFKEGSHVEKGDMLIKINDSDLQAQLKKLQLQVKLAADQEGRQKKLLEISGISQSDYDIALNQLNSLKADMEYTQAQIAKTELRAPFPGVIGLKNVSDGSYVSPSTSIAWMQQIDPVKIDFSIPEKYSSMVHTGDKIIFTAPNSRDTMSGDVYAIQPRVDVNTRTLQVRALSPNKSGKIIPGSFVQVQLVLKEIAGALMVPTEAIVPVLKGKNVYVLNNGKAVAKKVDTGIRTDTKIQVVDGIQAGDTIITSGIMQLRDGMPVTISNVK